VDEDPSNQRPDVVTAESLVLREPAFSTREDRLLMGFLVKMVFVSISGPRCPKQ
jgi:hypothetical protein